MTPTPDPFESLPTFPCFSTIPAEELAAAGDAFEVKRFPAGKDLFREGERGRYLYLVTAGRLSLRRQTREGPRAFRTAEAGDLLGEEILLGRRKRPFSAHVESEITVLRADSARLNLLRRRSPDAYAALRSVARGRRFASFGRFAWLQDDERVFLATRKAGALLAPGLILPVLLALASAAGAVAIGVSRWPEALQLLPVAGILLAAGAAVWQAIDWGNDYYFVTDRRVVAITRVPLIYDDRREVPLQTVQSVSFSSTMAQRMWGFGDVVIRTYTRPLVLQAVPNPARAAKLVEELWKRERERHKQDSREEIEELLRDRLAEAEQELEPETASTAARRPIPPAMPRVIGLLKTRQVTGESILYRKHLFFLLRNEFLPLLIAVIGVNLTAIAIVGIFPIDRLLGAAIGLAVTALGSGWMMYEYADWANDLFQVTPEQILAIHRKPLGDEERRAAALENILSLEYDRPSLLARLLNFGTVTATVGQTEFTFEELQDPVGVQEDIFRRMDQRRLAREERQRKERREEIASWIETYHRLTGDGEEEYYEEGADENADS